MEQNLVETIIKIEKELEQKLVQEKERALFMIEDAKTKCEKELALEEGKIKSLCNKSIQDALLKAKKDAEQLLSEANNMAKILENSTEEELKRIVKKELKRILPVHDC